MKYSIGVRYKQREGAFVDQALVIEAPTISDAVELVKINATQRFGWNDGWWIVSAAWLPEKQDGHGGMSDGELIARAILNLAYVVSLADNIECDVDRVFIDVAGELDRRAKEHA